MPKPNNKNNKNSDIKIKNSKSSLSEFVIRKIPTDEEVKNFDEYVRHEKKEEEIDESLSEIYQDVEGNKVNVSKIDIKKRRGFVFWLLSLILMIGFFTAAGYAIYYYLYTSLSADPTKVELTINAPNEVAAGQEFFYELIYKNLNIANINNIEINVIYPENFIFLDSQPQANANNNIWKFSSLPPGESGNIKIKGKIIAPLDNLSALAQSITYIPANFSSEFKKQSSREILISNIGVNLSADSNASALINEEREITIKYKAEANNYLQNFRFTLAAPANVAILTKSESEQKNIGIWQINDLSADEKELKIKFKAKAKDSDQEEFNLLYEYSDDGVKYYKFFADKISLEVIKSDLNLILIINGSRNNQSVDFGQTLNYSIVYANKGETEMKDVVIMAILEDEFLDKSSFNDKNGGILNNGTIIWTKDEIPNLESLSQNQEGIIDFAINILPLDKINLDKNNIDTAKKYQIKSYAQFSIGSKPADSGISGMDASPSDQESVKSNTIINSINSDLKLNEKLRYFNEDNIAVGYGPLPPKVGSATSYKVYWTISNNLHELNDLEITSQLPAYVNWDDKNQTTVGSLYYDNDNHKVVWHIGRLPISIDKVEAEFNIAITPSPDDKNKILVLLSGTSVSAIDKETGSVVTSAASAKTTKLEDDSIAGNDGVITD